MSIAVMIDGELRPPGAWQVSVFDRGFLYGDSVFETLRTYRGIPFELEVHMDRLARSAALVFIDLPVPRATLEAEVLGAIEAAQNQESYVRVMVTRGQGVMGLDPALAERPTRVIIVQPLTTPSERFYTDGISAITYRTQRQVDATSAVGAKVGNYLVSVLAMREASRVGAMEALIVDARGAVLEGGTSNVFLVEKGRLVTPDVSAGILAGHASPCPRGGARARHRRRTPHSERERRLRRRRALHHLEHPRTDARDTARRARDRQRQTRTSVRPSARGVPRAGAACELRRGEQFAGQRPSVAAIRVPQVCSAGAASGAGLPSEVASAMGAASGVSGVAVSVAAALGGRGMGIRSWPPCWAASSARALSK
jgi:branched-chain amino acid aminotransferase